MNQYNIIYLDISGFISAAKSLRRPLVEVPEMIMNAIRDELFFLNSGITRKSTVMVDCFAEEKYQGNELLVMKADRPVSDEEQQIIAREINFSM